MRSETEANRAVSLYADTVRRICFMHLKNHSDIEDVFQDVFLKYILYEHCFENDEHEKAWIIRVTINRCKDLLKSFFRRRVHSLEDINIEPFYIQEDSDAVLQAVLQLPDNYKNVVYLFYYEGYSAVEIAKMMGRKENTIYTWLARAKANLKTELGGASFDE